MYRMVLVLVLALGIAVPVYAGNKVTRKVDDFTGLEMVTFKKPLKFLRTKGVSVATAWLTPEVAKKPDGSIDWMRFHFKRDDYDSALGISKVSGSTLKLKLNNNEVIEFQAINNLSEIDIEWTSVGPKYKEYAIFDLSPHQLRAIAEASEIRGRVSGRNGMYVNIPHKHFMIHQDWLEEMRGFYNAVFSAVPTQAAQP